MTHMNTLHKLIIHLEMVQVRFGMARHHLPLNELARAIIAVKGGMTPTDIASQYNVHHSAVYRVLIIN